MVAVIQGKGGSNSEVVRLVFQGVDKLSGTVGTVTSSVGTLTGAVDLSRKSLLGFGNTVLDVFSKSVGIVDGFLGIIDNVNSALQSPVVQTYFAELDRAAKESLGSIVSVQSAIVSVNSLLESGRNREIRRNEVDQQREVDLAALKKKAKDAGKVYAESYEKQLIEEAEQRKLLDNVAVPLEEIKKQASEAGATYAESYEKQLLEKRSKPFSLGGRSIVVESAKTLGIEAGKGFASQYTRAASAIGDVASSIQNSAVETIKVATKNGADAGDYFAFAYNEALAETVNKNQAFEEVVQVTISNASDAGLQAGQNFAEGYSEGLSPEGQLLAELKSYQAPAIESSGQAGAEAGKEFGVQYAAQANSGIFSGIEKAELAVSNAVKNSKDQLGGGVNLLGGIGSGLFAAGGDVGEPLKILNAAESVAGKVASSFNEASLKIAFFYGSLQAMQQFVLAGPFQLLIQQNVELREQLLSTQASLVSTNKVLQDGVEITDPTQAINALQAPVEAAISKIRRDSLELVGVTSNDLVSVFNILTGQISSMGGGLNDAANLTIDFAAALGTLNIPLEQARQEIISIAQGQVTSDSALAKSIGLTNEQLTLWRQQGTLIDNITNRLEAFRAGNALASQTIGGIGSNIQEVIQETTRLAGAPLVDPIVEKLSNFLTFLQSQQTEITAQLKIVTGNLFLAGESIVSTFQAVVDALGPILVSIPNFLSNSLVRIVRQVESAVKGTLAVMQPFIDILAELAKRSQGFNPVFRLVIIFGTLSTAISSAVSAFQTFGASVPIVGEVMDFFMIRLNPMLNLFFNLSDKVGFGASSFLILGKNLQSIEPALNAVKGALGPIGPLVAAAIPAVASFGIQMVSLAPTLQKIGLNLSGLVAGGIDQLIKIIPGGVGAVDSLSASLLDFLKNSDLSSQFPILEGVPESLEGAISAFKALRENKMSTGSALVKAASDVDLITLANEKFIDVAKLSANAALKQIVTMGLFGAGAAGALFVFDQLVLKNEAVRKVFIAIGDEFKAFFGGIINLVKTPVGLTVVAIASLVLIINSGLLPSIRKLVAEYGMLGLTKATEALNLVNKQFIDLAKNIFKAAMSAKEFAVTQITTQFQGLRTSIANTRQEISRVGLRNFVTSLKTSGTGTGVLSTGLRGIAASARTATGAIGGFLLAAAPLIVLSVTIALVAEGMNTYNRIQSAATKETKELKEALDEQAEAMRKVRAEVAEANEEQVDPTSNEELERSGKERIEKDRSFLNKRFEDLLNLSSFLPNAAGKGFEKLLGEQGQNLAESYINGFANTTENGLVKFSAQVAKRLVRGENVFDFTDDEFENSIKDQGVAFDEASKAISAYEEDTQGLQNEYAALTAQFNSGAITQEQFDTRADGLNKKFEAQREAISGLREQITGINPATSALAARQAELTVQTDELAEALENGREVELAQKDLPRLGSAYEQMSQKLQDATNYIKEGTGSTELFGQKVEDVLKSVPSLFSDGFVNKEEAIAALELIANSTAATAEQQLAAQQEITKILQQEGDSRLKEIKSQQDKILLEQAQGKKTDIEAEQELTRLKQEEYDARTAALEENTKKALELLAEQEQAAIDGVNASIASIQTQISAVENDPKIGEEERAAAIKDLTAQETALLGRRDSLQEGYNARREKINKNAAREEEAIDLERAQSAAEAEKRMFDLRQAELERGYDKLRDATSEAESIRLTEIAKIRGQGVTALEESQLGIDELENRKRVISEEISLEKQRVIDLQNLGPLSDPEEEAQRQADIRKARLQTRQLIQQDYEIEAQLLDAQVKLIEEQIRAANQKVLNDNTRQTQELEKQLRLYDSLDKSLQAQSRLLQARADFAQSTVDSLTGQLDIISQGEQSEYRRSQLAQTAAAIKLQALQVQQQYELRSLELEQAQLEIAKQRELQENRIAQLKLQGEIAQGEAEVKVAETRFRNGQISQDELDAVLLQQQARRDQLVGLEEQRGFIQQEIALERELFDLRVRSTQQNQQLQVRQAQGELAASLPPGLRQRAQANLANQIAEDFGFEDSRQLRESGVGYARRLASQEFEGLPSTVGPLSAFDPELEGLSRVANGRLLGAAKSQTGREFQSQFGQFAFGGGSTLPAGAAVPFQLPSELKAANLSQIQFAGQGQQRPAEVATGSLERKFEELRQAILSRGGGNGINAQINVDANQKDMADQIANGVRLELDSVLREAEQRARANSI